ncbi:MAG: type I-E CRISPR-associated protein Cse2/CasB [Azoarcus sp.]|jgi:CRISPR system Cascade subunit CasB|nr:type I-E CRISPR-associated protein Cse2/CasB [Azoarcus sp.]
MRFDRKNAHGKVLHEWWEDLQEKNPAQKRKGDRAGRAALRRCATITQIVLTPAYQRLFHKLQQAEWSATLVQKDRLAAAVGLLAHVRDEDDQPLAKTMSACAEGSDRPNVSELRFLRLLESPDLETLFTGLRRVLPLIAHKANIFDLTNSLIFWGDKVKKDWAYAYDWPKKSSDA